MCGIAGAFWPHARDPEQVRHDLDVAVAAMHNRGPDSAGSVLWSPPDSGGALVAMGSTRLAVLDLSAAGQQPMSTADGRFTIVYNGEITNYVEIRASLVAEGVAFRSASDTEVLLEAWARWGEAALDRLEGMYAFAVLDRAERTLTLCRDPFGIKPLFVRHLPGDGIAFGSELAALLPLLPDRPRLNWRTAAAYLASGAYDDSAETFIEGVLTLRPGHRLVVSLAPPGGIEGRPSRWRPDIATDESITVADAVDGVRSRLIESVRRNLRSDVPVGVALSGGIDSSAIVGIVRALEPDYPLRVFSFVTPGHAADESRWIDLVTAEVGATALTVTPTPADLSADLDSVILAQGEPFGSTSIYAQYRVFRLMRESGIVVSLDGQGADEVFAGYHGYVGQRARSLVESGDLVGAASFLRAWSRWPGRSLAKGTARLGAEYAPRRAVDAAYRRVPGVVPVGVDRRALAARGLDWGWTAHPAEREGRRGVRVKAELRASLTERGLQALLRHGDRNSMRFSVESRVPYLDRSLVDFTLRLPETMLVDRDGTSKAVLRAAMRGIVPDAVLDRRDKVGFETPDALWIDSQRDAFASAIEHGPRIGFLDTSAIAAGVRGASSSTGGRPVPARLAWRLFNLYRWAALLDVDCD